MFTPLRLLGPAFVLGLIVSVAVADGPQDNIVENVRPIPPKGTDVPQAVRDEVQRGLAELQALIKSIGQHELLPDVLIYEKAVRWALDYNEVYDPAPPKDKKGNPPPPANNVKKVLAAGLERAKALKAGQTPWTTQTGPVLRGYRSKIDGSVQPYWLIVPKDYDFAAKTPHRLDFWWHGRGETLSEANFMANPANASGIIPAPGAFILHPYGRYCNANKFAGEIDTFECLEHAKTHYRIDENRLVARGFSMGGAACWQYAVHYPTLWAANAPGAGFSETPEFLKVFQKEDVKPTWYEQKLWRMYNATDYAANLFNLPTVAYSGEIDSQKQAADVMAREMKKEGLELVHIIGPKTGHSYEPGAKAEVNKRIDEIVAKGRDPWPKDFRFTTFTLRYNNGPGFVITGLEKHWERARVEGTRSPVNYPKLTTTNVNAMTIYFPGPVEVVSLVLDGTPLTLPINGKGPGEHPMRFRKVNGKWVPLLANAKEDTAQLAKKPGLQGPIDDAFMDSFVMVKPTGTPITPTGGKWVETEMKHATDHWRKQFRGDAIVKADTAITDADITNSNLILWGDPKSNAVLAKIKDKLPVNWDSRIVFIDGQRYEMPYFAFGGVAYPCDTHVPALIFPNPLNPSKYVVLNSGFTFREYDYLNNARQVPKLPDYAVIDITTPPNSRYPGKVIRAGFFGEKWELLPNDGQ